MSETAANAQLTPTAEDLAKGTPVIPPQDVKPTGSGETLHPTEEYEKERLAFLAAAETEEAPVPEVVPPVAVTPPTEAPPADDEIELDTPTGATPSEKAPRYRLKPQDGVEAVAFKLRAEADKAGTPISMKEAIARAEAAMPGAPAPSTPAKTQALPGAEASYEDVISYLKTAQPANETEAQNLIMLARSKRKEAFSKDLNTDAYAELDDVLYDLGKHSETLRNKATAEQQTRITAQNKALDDSKLKALELYPDVSTEANQGGQTALVTEMLRLEKVLIDSGNPIVNQGDYPLRLTQMAANNLGIAPGTKPTASPQPVVKSSRPVQPPTALGGARTTQAAVPSGQLEDKLNKISSIEDLEAAKRELAAST